MKQLRDQRLMAFWKYDLFPFKAWGEIAYFKDNGSVVIKNLGFIVKPEIILPYEIGHKKVRVLNRLKKCYDIDSKALEQKYIKEVEKTIKKGVAER